MGVPALLLCYFLGRDQWQSQCGLQRASTQLEDPGESIRIATWNLRNFGTRYSKKSKRAQQKKKYTQVRRQLDEISASVLALQEIRNPEALGPLLPHHQLWFSSTGGRGGQYLGFAYDPQRVRLIGEPIEHVALSLNGRVRPAVSARFRSQHNSFDFRMIVVHLKARPDGYDQRRLQWTTLIEEIKEIDQSPHRDPDLIVVGDFNTTGPKNGSTAKELAVLDRLFATVDLYRVTNESGCSAYWDGPKRDAWKEASLLDLIWASKRIHQNLKSKAQPLAQCARHHCRAFRSTEAYPDPDFALVSDHCPIVVDLDPRTSMSLHRAQAR